MITANESIYRFINDLLKFLNDLVINAAHRDNVENDFLFALSISKITRANGMIK